MQVQTQVKDGGIVPEAFVIPWKGRNYWEDDLDMEIAPQALNTPTCMTCKRTFRTNHHCESHNIFAAKLHCVHDKYELQILWEPQCTRCLAIQCHDQNMRWPELSGWFINWSESMGWDVVVLAAQFCRRESQDPMLPFELQRTVALRVFLYLAARGGAFPAQNSSSEQEEQRREQEHQERMRQWALLHHSPQDTHKQTKLSRFFVPTQETLAKKRKRQEQVEAEKAIRKASRPKTDPLQSDHSVKHLLQHITSAPQEWLQLYWYDERLRLQNQCCLCVDFVVLPTGETKVSLYRCLQTESGYGLQYWCLGKDCDYPSDLRYMVSCADTEAPQKRRAVWTLWCGQGNKTVSLQTQKQAAQRTHALAPLLRALIHQASFTPRLKVSHSMAFCDDDDWWHRYSCGCLVIPQCDSHPNICDAILTWWNSFP